MMRVLVHIGGMKFAFSAVTAWISRHDVMRPAAVVVFPFVIGGCGHPGEVRPFDVVIRGPEASCSIFVAGRQVTIQELLNIARKEVSLRRHASIGVMASQMPYRCIGGTIYTLQSAGFTHVPVTGVPSLEDPVADHR